MRLKKFLRFVVLLIFIMLASVAPVPIKFYGKDNQPCYKIEQIDKKKEDEDTENGDEVF